MRSSKKILFFLFFLACIRAASGQDNYDSISFSRFMENKTIKDLEAYRSRWTDMLRSGSFREYLSDEKTIWSKPQNSRNQPPLLTLIKRMRTNGTEDISKCFYPRHSINFYKKDAIIRYILVCFECDGVRFSDDTSERFIKNVSQREKQMMELKMMFIHNGISPGNQSASK